MARKTAFTEAHKQFIVTQLAVFEHPKAIAKQLRESFPDDFPNEVPNWYAVAAYDPTRRFGRRKPAKQWIQLFEATRAEFLKKMGNYAVTHQTWRVATYQRLIDEALELGNRVLAADLIERATKDLGGLFTNRRIVQGDVATALAALLGVNPAELNGPGIPKDMRKDRHVPLLEKRARLNAGRPIAEA